MALLINHVGGTWPDACLVIMSPAVSIWVIHSGVEFIRQQLANRTPDNFLMQLACDTVYRSTILHECCRIAYLDTAQIRTKRFLQRLSRIHARAVLMV